MDLFSRIDTYKLDWHWVGRHFVKPHLTFRHLYFRSNPYCTENAEDKQAVDSSLLLSAWDQIKYVSTDIDTVGPTSSILGNLSFQRKQKTSFFATFLESPEEIMKLLQTENSNVFPRQALTDIVLQYVEPWTLEVAISYGDLCSVNWRDFRKRKMDGVSRTEPVLLATLGG